MAKTPPVAKAGTMQVQPRNPYMDGSGPYNQPPSLNYGNQFDTIGTGGLRQYSGWVREEFLPQLQGRQAVRTYREMLDNSPTVGAVIFAIRETVRQVQWRLNPPTDGPDDAAAVEFVESCMNDMSHTWPDFTSEQLSMLGYGFAPFELVYKRRMGRKPRGAGPNKPAPSKYDDGLIGWRKIPLRGQDTVIKWFFASDGAITGMTQQPWIGALIDIPIEKMVLFRPRAHKNNPEGNSILRTAYRPWYFTKRLEEQEAIMFERFSGLPIVTVPNILLEKANAGDEQAIAIVEAYKTIGRNIRVDDQMCVVLPSDTFVDPDGKYTSVKMYNVEFAAPQSGRSTVSADTSITRYKLDIMTSVLADFLTLGHSSRGTQSLANTKVDLFFQATEGWVSSNAEVMNRYALPRLWKLNAFDEENQPMFAPDMPQRTDLDVLSNFVLRLSQAGMPLGPDPDTDAYLRDAAGLPDVTEEGAANILASLQADANASEQPEAVKKFIAGAIARRLVKHNYRPDLLNTKRKRRPRRAAGATPDPTP